METKVYRNEKFDQERALYGARNILLDGCAFEGEADGESALKESEKVWARGTRFALRYPLWHTKEASLSSITMTETCRAPLWYARGVHIKDGELFAPKAVRECEDVTLLNCEILSEEFGWFSSKIGIANCSIAGAYSFLRSRDITAREMRFEGKYSFQYVENARFVNCHFKTKDAFWHAKNVTVENAVIEGEYLGWYSEGLRLVRCHIKGTQPLCYAKDLVLEDCTMEGCDLAFEKSTVTATVKGHIDSIKAPAGGEITADSVGEILPQNDGEKGKAAIRVTSSV